MSHAEPMQVCPKCRKQDYTSFSKCRFCGTKYDAIVNEEKSTIDFKFMFVLLFAGLLFFGGQAVHNFMKAEQAKHLAPLAAEIKARKRPRVVEFYATWCGPCQSYAPTLEALQEQYGDRIDFYRLDVDQPQNQNLAEMLSVSAIPRTCIFDSEGNLLLDATGMQRREKLEKALTSTLEK
ncbi:MAG: hypothetical protein IPP57_00655 [Candidatus Obscuribacter sp.]|jgi:thioredoxin 1|nr:hypothetical protein [Candidatus Obscuribacter sp.]MBK9203133.1 hypothetical protein [Candidatus Obscuribacter sp.]MBK9619249.1 hypothetical protein [Candidatus Obscuribacter sp.]MBK9769338.1 hypothetical protein [Candidatus Obscuribacter sp.]